MTPTEFYKLNGMPSPWADTLPVSPDPHGWFSDENQLGLTKLLLERKRAGHPVRTVCEIGCWLGKSTRWFAERVELVIAVDHWLGNPEHRAVDRDDCRYRLPVLYPQFLANCWPLRHKIAPVREFSTVAGATLRFPPLDLVYVDADHSAAAVAADVLAFAEHLSPGGIICGDDWDRETVQAGARQALKSLGRAEPQVHGPFWFSEK
jgi:predicted O-methyltransferase YrrM